MRIYITHCSAKKNEEVKRNNESTTPDNLYTSLRTQRFINRCKKERVNWAIFSDLYGVWFSNEKHKWYEKSPEKVNKEEIELLVENFDINLKKFDEIYFYHNPGRFHKTYITVLSKSRLKDKIVLFSNIDNIKGR